MELLDEVRREAERDTAWLTRDKADRAAAEIKKMKEFFDGLYGKA